MTYYITRNCLCWDGGFDFFGIFGKLSQIKGAAAAKSTYRFTELVTTSRIKDLAIPTFRKSINPGKAHI